MLLTGRNDSLTGYTDPGAQAEPHVQGRLDRRGQENEASVNSHCGGTRVRLVAVRRAEPSLGEMPTGNVRSEMLPLHAQTLSALLSLQADDEDEDRRKTRLAVEIAVFSGVGVLEVLAAVLLCCWTKELKRRELRAEERERPPKKPVPLLAVKTSESGGSQQNKEGGQPTRTLRRNAVSVSYGTIWSFLGDGALGSASQSVFRMSPCAAGKGAPRKRRKVRREQSAQSFWKLGLAPIRLDAGD